MESRLDSCCICGHRRDKVFSNTLLGKYVVDYLYCGSCGLLQTETPYWLDEAYSDAIVDTDTGLVGRNLAIARRVATLLFLAFNKKGRYLDIAGGYGLFTRLMRDVGFDFYWLDPYCKNLLARGFEFQSELLPFNAVTAFEVLEHVTDPIVFIQDSLSKADSDTFIFTTKLFSGEPAAPGTWWYYTPETGQHITFFQRRTLEVLAEKLKLRVYSHKEFHMLTRRPISQTKWLLAMGRASRLFYPLVVKCMQSKIMTDRESLLKRRY